MIVSPQQIFSYLIQQHGVSVASAAGILANIKAESGFNTSIVGDGGTSGGLFQHHAGRWASLKSYAKSTGRAWDDWTAQVDFAIKEAKGMGINLQATDARAASKEWTIKFERPADMYTKAEKRAGSVNEYLQLDPGADYAGPAAAGGGGPVPSGDASPSASGEKLNLPTGGSWFRAKDGTYYVAYRFYGSADKKGPSQVIYYESVTPPPAGVDVNPPSSWERWNAQWIDGGSTDTWRGFPKGKSFQEHVNETLFELGLMGSDALSDPGVMAVVAIALTREMSPAELSNRLRQTDWWKSRTDKEREWDDLSPAERDQRIQDAMSQLASSWFTYVGVDLQVGQYDTDGDGLVSSAELKKANPELWRWSQRVASGKASVVTAVNTWMKDEAMENPDSPWARTVREEEKAQGQHAVDVDTMAGQIEDLYYEWGIPLSDKKARQLAEKVVMNQLSFEDVEDEVQEQAAGLYPHKPKQMSTRQYAMPYMQSYMQLLETPEPELTDDMIQAAISSGMTLADFRNEIRHDDRWLETDNARSEFNTKFSQLGRQLGF